MNRLLTVLFGFVFACLGMNAWASSGDGSPIMDFTSTGMGIAAVIIFAFSFLLEVATYAGLSSSTNDRNRMFPVFCIDPDPLP